MSISQSVCLPAYLYVCLPCLSPMCTCIVVVAAEPAEAAEITTIIFNNPSLRVSTKDLSSSSFLLTMLDAAASLSEGRRRKKKVFLSS